VGRVCILGREKTMRAGWIIGIIMLAGVPGAVLGQYHTIDPVGIDLSPGWGTPRDGLPEFWVAGEVLETGYQGIPMGILLNTSPIPGPAGSLAYRVQVVNVSGSWLSDVVLTVEDYGMFYGDPTGHMFLSETVWNPPALAGGDTPAYPLGDIPPGGWRDVEVFMIRGFDPPMFHRIDAASIGFNSSEEVPGFSDVSVLVVPEPATLSLLALGGVALIRRRR